MCYTYFLIIECAKNGPREMDDMRIIGYLREAKGAAENLLYVHLDMANNTYLNFILLNAHQTNYSII